MKQRLLRESNKKLGYWEPGHKTAVQEPQTSFVERFPSAWLKAQLLASAVLCLVVQLCLTLCDPMDCSPPGSSVHGISQTRILECAAMPSSRGSSWSRDQTQVSCTAGRFFIVWVTREAPICRILNFKRALSALKIGCVWHALCFWATTEDHNSTGVRGQTLEG